MLKIKVGDKVKILNFPIDINLGVQTIKKIKYPYFWTEHIKAGNIENTEFEIIS